MIPRKSYSLCNASPDVSLRATDQATIPILLLLLLLLLPPPQLHSSSVSRSCHLSFWSLDFQSNPNIFHPASPSSFLSSLVTASIHQPSAFPTSRLPYILPSKIFLGILDPFIHPASESSPFQSSGFNTCYHSYVLTYTTDFVITADSLQCAFSCIRPYILLFSVQRLQGSFLTDPTLLLPCEKNQLSCERWLRAPCSCSETCESPVRTAGTGINFKPFPAFPKF